MRKLVWVLLALLLAWNSWLTYAMVQTEENALDDSQETVSETGTTVVHNVVNGYTTDITKTVSDVQSKLVTVSVEKENQVKNQSGVIYRSNGRDCYILTSADSMPLIKEQEVPEEEEELIEEETEEEEVPEEIVPEEVIRVTFDNSSSMRAELVGIDHAADLALLLVHPQFEVDAIAMGSSEFLNRGEYVISLSGRDAESGNGAVSFGVVSSPLQIYHPADEYGDEGIIRMLITDTQMSPVGIGGPLVNLNGELVGMIVGNRVSETLQGENMTAAVASSEIRIVVDQLIEKGYVHRSYLGVIGRNVSEMDLYERSGFGVQLDVADGVFVTSVIPDSPAAKAGISANDVILKIGDNKIYDLESLHAFLCSDILLMPQRTELNRKGSTFYTEVSMYEIPEEEPDEEVVE